MYDVMHIKNKFKNLIRTSKFSFGVLVHIYVIVILIYYMIVLMISISIVYMFIYK